MARFRPGFWPTVFTIPALILMVALGWWQLERREWKHELISRLEARLSASPVTLEQARREPDAAEFRRIAVAGRFLQEHELHYPGRTLGGRVGVEIMTPMAIEGGGYVLVDRGWVPQEAIRQGLSLESRPEGVVRVEGAVRLPPEPGWFTPENAPGQNQWFSVDLSAAAREAGIDAERMMPFYVVAGPAGSGESLPAPRGTHVDLPDNHLQYAITWFSLAAVLVVIYVLYHVRTDRDR